MCDKKSYYPRYCRFRKRLVESNTLASNNREEHQIEEELNIVACSTIIEENLGTSKEESALSVSILGQVDFERD